MTNKNIRMRKFLPESLEGNFYGVSFDFKNTEGSELNNTIEY